MENKNTFIWLVVIFALSALVLSLGLIRLDPRATHWLGLIFITIAVLLFFWALIGALLLASRAWRKKNQQAAVSLRQASFVSIAVVLALYLARFNLLTWLNIIIMVAILVFLEIFFIGKEEILQ